MWIPRPWLWCSRSRPTLLTLWLTLVTFQIRFSRSCPYDARYYPMTLTLMLKVTTEFCDSMTIFQGDSLTTHDMTHHSLTRCSRSRPTLMIMWHLLILIICTDTPALSHWLRRLRSQPTLNVGLASQDHDLHTTHLRPLTLTPCAPGQRRRCGWLDAGHTSASIDLSRYRQPIVVAQSQMKRSRRLRGSLQSSRVRQTLRHAWGDSAPRGDLPPTNKRQQTANCQFY